MADLTSKASQNKRADVGSPRAKRTDPASRALRSIGKRLRRLREGGDERRFLHAARGIIHVGANTGQEASSYAKLGVPVVWIEPLPEVFKALQQHVSRYANQVAFDYLISDVENKDYVFHDAGQSSSILEFADHKKLWPSIDFTGTHLLRSRRLDSLIEEHGWTSPPYDALIVDAQGADLLVLKGLGSHIADIRFLVVEAADFEAYKGGATVDEISAFLEPLGFILKHKAVMAGHKAVGTYYNLYYVKP